jgi:hypothetical protein
VIRKLIFLLYYFGLGIYGRVIFAATQPQIGTIISVVGQAEAIDASNNKRALQRHSAIYLKDRIVTQKESKAQFILDDDSVIIVQSSSEFYVSEFVFDKKSSRNNRYVGNFVKGALINISGKGETKNYRVETPLLTIAFRGTDFATNLKMEGNRAVSEGFTQLAGQCGLTSKCLGGIPKEKCKSSTLEVIPGQSVEVGLSGTFRPLIVSMRKEGSSGAAAEMKIVKPSSSTNASNETGTATESSTVVDTSTGKGVEPGSLSIKCK